MLSSMRFLTDEPLFKELDIFFNQFKPSIFKKRDVILNAYDNSACVFYVKEGYVRIYRVSEQGEELTLIILKPSDLFPVSLGSADIPNHYYLEAITDVKIIKVPYEQFWQFVNQNPAVFFELTNYIISRFRGLLMRIEYLTFGNAYTKVAATLLVCAKRFGVLKGENVLVDLPLTHKDIATLVGLTRETTCLEMKKLEKKGLVYHEGRSFIVKNIKRLEDESLLGAEQDSLLNNSL